MTTARRELAEETGITDFKTIEGFRREIRYDVTSPRYGPGVKSVAKRVIYFLAFAPSDKVTISPEHDEYRWLSSDEMLELIAFDNLRAAFSAALSHLAV